MQSRITQKKTWNAPLWRAALGFLIIVPAACNELSNKKQGGVEVSVDFHDGRTTLLIPGGVASLYKQFPDPAGPVVEAYRLHYEARVPCPSRTPPRLIDATAEWSGRQLRAAG